MKIVKGIFRKSHGVVVHEAQYLENPDSDEIPRWAREWGVEELRFVADPKTKKLYIFPAWLLHSDFLQTHLKINYEDIVDTMNMFFGVIKIVEKGSPYAVIESSQIRLAVLQHNSIMELFLYLEKSYDWLRTYGIEPVEALISQYKEQQLVSV